MVAPGMMRTAFVHEVYKGQVSLLASYRKNFVNDYNAKTPYGKYSDQLSAYYIDVGGTVTRISSNNSVLALFEPHRKEIQRYMKQRKFKFRKAGMPAWRDLMTFIDKLGKPQP